MPQGPDVPTAEHEVFASPPLKAMLGQVRFPPLLKINDLAFLADFQEAIRADFPNFAPEQQFNLVLGPEGPQNANVSRAYRFTSADGAWSILIAPDSLTLEVIVAESYTEYGDFVTRFRTAWSAFETHVSPSSITRQGLRYVDHLEGDQAAAEWASQINPDLLGAVMGPLGVGLERSLSEYRFQRDAGTLVFKHGMLPAGPDDRPGYLLDFDYFAENLDSDTSTQAVVDRFDDYHSAIHDLFRWSVTEAAIEGFRRGR